MLEINKIHQGDCLELMKQIDDKSVDLILCDLPYGTTQCKWDTVIPLDKLWEQYERIIKEEGVIVLTSSQPFTSALVMSNPKLFRYDYCWRKSNSTGHLNANKMPLRQHEDILVFCRKMPKYNPQFFNKVKPRSAQRTVKAKGAYGDNTEGVFRTISDKKGYPRSVLEFNTAYHNRTAGLHPTQKPVPLFEYLIRTYTDEGDLVLDNCVGSGTTVVASKRANRNFIGIEKDKDYVNIANKRLSQGVLLPLDVNTKEDGLPPTPKGMGIRPTIL
ncbi:hypothetical protein LCGC14_1219960 [marine sediment metagenome]|uniref:DNA methylase N-4/N-6 domain-containing protein n=1 Tax=marine sediment metagenome TaxID=412755 RepID=A0A0F9LFK5_9ZZZZ